jgi:hypothetical protein
MTTYTLQVQIDTAPYTVLKARGFNLAVAQKVGQQYSVFFQALVVGQTYNVPTVLSSTLDQPVTSSKTCITKPDETPSPAHRQSDEVNLETHPYRSTSIGASASPIFASPNLVDSTAITLAAWFHLQIDTGVIIVDIRTAIIDVPYEPGTTSHAVGFVGTSIDDSTWVIENSLGQVIAQPRRSYNSAIGSTYADSGLDPYALVQAAHGYIPSRNSAVHSSIPWLTECKVSFPTSEAADHARAYLKQKVIYNIHQRVSDKTDSVTFHVKLRWGRVMFMPEMMAGSTDEEKIQNAFNAELRLLAMAPTSSDYITDNQLDIARSPCVFLAYGTHVTLDRDVHSQTAVVGDSYEPVVFVIIFGFGHSAEL